MFKKMTAEFDDPSISKMMQNRLKLVSNLSYALDLNDNQDELFNSITLEQIEEMEREESGIVEKSENLL